MLYSLLQDEADKSKYIEVCIFEEINYYDNISTSSVKNMLKQQYENLFRYLNFDQ